MMKFYEEENGKQISFWKFLEITKLTSGLNPTHSFELLKPHRLKQYEDTIVIFNDEMALNEVEITPIDIPMLYSDWLNDELKIIEQWLSDKYPNGDKKKPLLKSEKIEIVKYKTFISNEIDSTISDEPNNKKVDSIISDKPIESNPYPNIFVDKGFQVWESMFEEFDIKESSRSDVKFMFEMMQKDKMIYGTVKQVDFLDWLSKKYGFVVEKISNYSKTKERISIYNTAKSTYFK